MIYIDSDFEGPLSSHGDDTALEFGFHLGLGLDLDIGRGAYLSGDARWNFYDASDHLEGEDLDFLLVTFGIFFRFG